MLHLFGDSFTAGTGLKPKTPRSVSEPFALGKYKDYSWDSQLSTKYGYKIFNHGVGGVSNSYILHTILKNLSSFKPGDRIVLGTTSPYRMFTYHRKNKVTGIQPLTLDILTNEEYSSHISEEDKTVLSGYFNYLYPKYGEFENEFILASTYSLLNLLKSINVNYLVWDYNIWFHPYFESLKEWTNDQFQDYHWSPNTHTHFAAILDYCLKNKISYIGDDFISLNYERLCAHFEYIECEELA